VARDALNKRRVEPGQEEYHDTGHVKQIITCRMEMDPVNSAVPFTGKYFRRLKRSWKR
jgi:hypothetical protein